VAGEIAFLPRYVAKEYMTSPLARNVLLKLP